MELDSLGNLQRTDSCGALTLKDVGRSVTLMGWVDVRRDLGNLIFVDLRDREGITQVVFKQDVSGEAHARAKELRSEYVAAVEGQVVARALETVNPALSTGEVEVQARRLWILNDAQTPPFQVSDAAKASEDIRLKYRFLDLRRPKMQRTFRLRHQAMLEIRTYLDSKGFLEIETPILTKSTPEGARDYLVPSRVQPERFYALPQSPQLFKQILMMSGFDKYFQIVRCFRDEDLRADRQPEFTQVDLEMSFVQPDQIFTLIEPLLQRVFRLVGTEVPLPFPRLTYDEALRRFGSDKPDLRFSVELQDLSPLFKDSEFRVFRSIVEEGGVAKAIAAPGGAKYSRRELEIFADVVKQLGATGLAWIKAADGEISSSLPKVVLETRLRQMLSACGAAQGDLLLVVAGAPKVVAESLGALRVHLSKQEQWADPRAFQFLWVTDFPLFEWSEEENRYVSCNHPFTAPVEQDLDRLESDPARVKSKAYDVVLNGTEIGGGSIRIHRSDLQQRVFRALGISDEEAERRFGFFLEALKYGTPPHGGIALGLDRIIMLMAGESSIRDVIAFPKTARGTDLMTESPAEVSPEQLRELKIRFEK
ncbi:MAG: aspartate--tRNA ligase [Acidobacteria bacterium]|nr:aspartate--tRNA ligase [Acidobacteriota bacterium]